MARPFGHERGRVRLRWHPGNWSRAVRFFDEESKVDSQFRRNFFRQIRDLMRAHILDVYQNWILPGLSEPSETTGEWGRNLVVTYRQKGQGIGVTVSNYTPYSDRFLRPGIPRDPSTAESYRQADEEFQDKHRDDFDLLSDSSLDDEQYWELRDQVSAETLSDAPNVEDFPSLGLLQDQLIEWAATKGFDFADIERLTLQIAEDGTAAEIGLFEYAFGPTDAGVEFKRRRTLTIRRYNRQLRKHMVRVLSGGGAASFYPRGYYG